MAVMDLVATHGWRVSDAVRHVVGISRPIAADPKAFRNVRAAYYLQRSKTKPKQP